MEFIHFSWSGFEAKVNFLNKLLNGDASFGISGSICSNIDYSNNVTEEEFD